jgi:hypothetical protein
MSKIQSAGDGPAGNEPVLGYARTSPPSAMAVLLCRVLAIWMLAWGFYSASDSLSQAFNWLLNAQRPPVSTWFAFFIDLGLTAGIWFSFAWYCWTRAPALAEKMAGLTDPPVSSSPMTSDELMHVLLIGIGIYLLADGLPLFLGSLIVLGFKEFIYPRDQFEIHSWVITGAIRCGLGLLLIIRTHWVAAFFRRRARSSRDRVD